MGNCATCCGKQDNNEIITEKQNKLRGVSNDNNYAVSNEYLANGYLPGGKKGIFNPILIVLNSYPFVRRWL
jgi:hypothetical protein